MTQWDSLYKKFRETHNYLKNAPSGSAASATDNKFAYYEQMRFVESSMHYRAPLSTLQNISTVQRPLPATTSSVKQETIQTASTENLPSTGSTVKMHQGSIWQLKPPSADNAPNPNKLINTWNKPGRSRKKSILKTPAIDKFASKKLTAVNQTQDLLTNIQDILSATSATVKESFAKPHVEENVSMDPNVELIYKNDQI